MEAGHILGPFDNPPLPNLWCSGLGTVPKHDGGWRIIYHLSAPPGISINDFIAPNSYTRWHHQPNNSYTPIVRLMMHTL